METRTIILTQIYTIMIGHTPRTALRNQILHTHNPTSYRGASVTLCTKESSNFNQRNGYVHVSAKIQYRISSETSQNHKISNIHTRPAQHARAGRAWQCDGIVSRVGMQCAGGCLMHAFWTYALAVVGPAADTLSRYLSTTYMAQCTEHARTSGGSPAPATEKMVQSTAHHVRVSVPDTKKAEKV